MNAGYLEEAPITPEAQELYDEDVTESGYVWNVSRLWAYQPDIVNRLFELMSEALKPSRLHFRQRGILVTAAASTLRDSYCSLAWGGKLAKASDPAVAAGVLCGNDAGFDRSGEGNGVLDAKDRRRSQRHVPCRHSGASGCRAHR